MAAQDAKTRLYESALDLMGRNGIAATATREILAAAGIKNPSAISYHFGSKGELVEALATEIASGQYPIFAKQTALAAGGGPVPVAEWVAPVIDTAIQLVSTERGCLLARIWWEHDGYISPQSLEAFIGGDSEIATQWRAAAATALPHLPPQIGIARNVAALRTIGWMLARMAAINLTSDPFIVRKHTRFRMWLTEISVTLVGSPTELSDEDVRGPDTR